MSNGKVSVDVSSESSNILTYVLSATWYPKRKRKNVPKRSVLGLCWFVAMMKYNS